ncbi:MULTISPECIES: hypothetical protein [unclassified Methanosarcina]|uniref:hypothetical protein n=1 Tax=unclassified Methanosarcina TaxID=2644672 RepID=UPI000616142D|nr:MULTISPECIES: hypothetical protein [unclassified Methanosarcina]AKB19094.1 hypothetical protein MSWHS_2231 [Methanosarcina sp. WWM596]AKB23075.1 hypothetical protein MSWH1_2804 [Methanosarcina sp. WH1]
MKREKEEITVLIRATPEKSRRNGEVHAVGVTGINKAGELLRLYPLRFRYGEGLVDFRKNDLLEVMVTKPEHDLRLESRKVLDYVNLEKPAKDRKIKELILPLVTSLERLSIEGVSLGVVKPELLDVEVKVNSIETYDRQQYFNMMGDFLEKGEKARMPVEVRYTFRCEGEEACRGHRINLLDWELNETVRNIVREKREHEAVKKKIEEQLFELLKEKELYFIMGTHFTYGTWMITGIFCPEKEGRNQSSIFDFKQGSEATTAEKIIT